MSKGFISYALTQGVGSFDDIVTWLYLDSQGPKLLKEVVEESRELLARRSNGEVQPGKEPLSLGAEVLLKRYLPLLEEKVEG